MTTNKKQRILLIGCSMAGKTTLCQYMHQEDLRYHKTQTIQLVHDKVIDTPGEYLERTNMRGALTMIAVDAAIIGFVQPANGLQRMFPPGYSSTFAKPCIGIVTKSDLATPKEIEDTKEYLKAAGAGEIFVTSCVEGTGFTELLGYFKDTGKTSEERMG